MADSKAKASNVYPLEHPVTINGATYSELTFRRMIGKDAYIGQDETNEIRAGYMLYAALAGVPVEVFEEMANDDVEGATEVAIPMMGKRAATAMKAAKANAEKLLGGAIS